MNKKGFTLVELVAVITLLGVIALIVSPVVSNTINNSKQKAYDEIVRQLENAAIRYGEENMHIFDDIETTYYRKITAKELMEAGYLRKQDTIINPKTKQEMTGCVFVTYDESHNQYDYEYNEDCETILPDYVYQIMVNAKDYYKQNLKNPNEKVNFNGATNLLQKLSGEKPNDGVLYLDKDGNIAMAFVYNNKCYTKYFTTGYSVTEDTKNCGVNTDIVINSSYVGFGGEYLDSFEKVITTSDGGYLIVGSSNSTKYSNLTGYGENINDDVFIIKYNSSGNILWNISIAGSSTETIKTIIEEDDCYTLIGQGYSLDGFFSNFLDSSSYQNMFALKLSKTNGSVIFKKVLATYTSEAYFNAVSLIKHDGYYYAAITGRHLVPNASSTRANIIKYDENFNQVWAKDYTKADANSAMGLVLTQNNTLVLAGYSTGVGTYSSDVLNDIRIPSKRYGFLLEVSLSDGSVISKATIGGSTETYTEDICEVSDGYVVVGYSSANDGHFSNKSKGKSDGFIAKFGKTPNSSGVLPLIWVKTFGGEENDSFNRVIVKDDQIIAIGYSSSINYDMQGVSIASNKYRDGIIAKYDLDGNLTSKKAIGGTNDDSILDIAIDKNNIIIVGTTYSTDTHFQSFNYGNQDGFMMKLDGNFNQLKDFNVKPLLMSSVPELAKNYGTSIPQPGGADTLKLYTTNDPTKDLGLWCTSGSGYSSSNYRATNCLYPFNNSDEVKLYEDVFKLSNTVNVQADKNEWISMYFYYGNSYGPNGISNVKVKFEGHEATTIEQAVQLGYIEPLVLVGSGYSDMFNVLSGGATGTGRYGSAKILIKPKNIKLEQITFDSVTETTTNTGTFRVYQYHNFDISLTQSK